MKLAEALVQRADIQKRIEQLRERLKLSELVQEGEQPPESPSELIADLERMVVELTSLIGRINRANLSTQLADGTTLTDALARRDTLQLHYNVLKTVVETASNRVDRYSRTEIKRVSTIDVSAMRKQMDDLSKQRRELDTAIQSANWLTELAE